MCILPVTNDSFHLVLPHMHRYTVNILTDIGDLLKNRHSEVNGMWPQSDWHRIQSVIQCTCTFNVHWRWGLL